MLDLLEVHVKFLAWFLALSHLIYCHHVRPWTFFADHSYKYRAQALMPERPGVSPIHLFLGLHYSVFFACITQFLRLSLGKVRLPFRVVVGSMKRLTQHTDTEHNLPDSSTWFWLVDIRHKRIDYAQKRMRRQNNSSRDHWKKCQDGQLRPWGQRDTELQDPKIQSCRIPSSMSWRDYYLCNVFAGRLERNNTRQ